MGDNAYGKGGKAISLNPVPRKPFVPKQHAKWNLSNPRGSHDLSTIHTSSNTHVLAWGCIENVVFPWSFRGLRMVGEIPLLDHEPFREKIVSKATIYTIGGDYRATGSDSENISRAIHESAANCLCTRTSPDQRQQKGRKSMAVSNRTGLIVEIRHG